MPELFFECFSTTTKRVRGYSAIKTHISQQHEISIFNGFIDCSRQMWRRRHSIIAAVSQRKKTQLLLFKPHHFQTHRLHHKIQQAFIILQRFCFVKLCQGPINNAGAHYFKRNFSNIFCSTTMSNLSWYFHKIISESNLSKTVLLLQE